MLMLAATLFAALAIGPLHVATGIYDGRNGTAEALDDWAAGLPLKLYYYRNYQIDAGTRIPGILCPRSVQSSAKWKPKLVLIEEGDFAEGRRQTQANWRRAHAARAFAYLYNATMYDVHRSELQRACPGIKLEPFEPALRLDSPRAEIG
jgi:hypothetical protein